MAPVKVQTGAGPQPPSQRRSLAPRRPSPRGVFLFPCGKAHRPTARAVSPRILDTPATNSAAARQALSAECVKIGRNPAIMRSYWPFAGSAEAHDYSADIICRVTETDGQRSAWSFAPNTIGADGSPVSTFVETSYLGHGKSVVSQPGSRPVWLMTTNPVGGATLLPRNNPGWSLIVSNLAPTGTTISGGCAVDAPSGPFRPRQP
jgi:hypothetical protein